MIELTFDTTKQSHSGELTVCQTKKLYLSMKKYYSLDTPITNDTIK